MAVCGFVLALCLLRDDRHVALFEDKLLLKNIALGLRMTQCLALTFLNRFGRSIKVHLVMHFLFLLHIKYVSGFSYNIADTSRSEICLEEDKVRKLNLQFRYILAGSWGNT